VSGPRNTGGVERAHIVRLAARPDKIATNCYASVWWRGECTPRASFHPTRQLRNSEGVSPTPRKSPLQLDLFQPRDYEFDFRVILTNKVTDDAEAVMDFHHGRGSQEV
jgi:hypothetical protein